jgi:hypothetical protein
LVMGTGIIALGASQAGLASISWGLFQVTKAAYAVLWLLLLARLTFFGRRVIEDLISRTRGAGFLTVVAATCVLGSQCVILSRDRDAALYLRVMPADLSPPYWINMGALAISTLAGGLLVTAASHWGTLRELAIGELRADPPHLARRPR